MLLGDGSLSRLGAASDDSGKEARTLFLFERPAARGLYSYTGIATVKKLRIPCPQICRQGACITKVAPALFLFGQRNVADCLYRALLCIVGMTGPCSCWCRSSHCWSCEDLCRRDDMRLLGLWPLLRTLWMRPKIDHIRLFESSLIPQTFIMLERYLLVRMCHLWSGWLTVKT